MCLVSYVLTLPPYVEGEDEKELCGMMSNLMMPNDETGEEGDMDPDEKMYARGLELKAQRDEMAEMLTKDEHKKELDALSGDMKVHAFYWMMAVLTVRMTSLGVIEEEKHMSVTYFDEHVDVMSSDGGKAFKKQMEVAIHKGRLLNIRRNDILNDPRMKQLEEEGDSEGRLRLLQETMIAHDTELDALRVLQGLPLEEKDDKFLCTLIDDELFAPPPPRPECPICFLTLPWRKFCTYQPCCGKTLCDGCLHAHRETFTTRKFNCAFCRTPVSTTDKERVKLTKKRMENGDSEAYFMFGAHTSQGSMGLTKDVGKSLELWKKAAELGDLTAHISLGQVFSGHHDIILGVEKDEKRAMHHYRLAAIRGVLDARYTLGSMAYNSENQNMKLAMKHWIMAANAGHDTSLEMVQRGYKHGYCSKDEFAKTLRAHKAATDEMMSDQRDEARMYHETHTRERASQRAGGK